MLNHLSFFICFSRIVLKSKFYLHFFVVLVVCLPTFLNAYEVVFNGVSDSKTLELIQSVSILEKLKDSPPSSLAGLKRRAENDREPIIQALHSLAYYEATLNYAINEDRSTIDVNINLNQVFPFKEIILRFFQGEEEVSDDVLHCPITLKDLAITLGKPALPETILSAEDTLLDKLNLQGYAFAKILKRDVFADLDQKDVIVSFVVDLGPLTYNGNTKISGLTRLRKAFIQRKIRWKEGCIYSPTLIEKTQDALELSGLFRSVNIAIAEEPIDGNLMPIEIAVVEGKQRSVGFGLNFTTELGPGVITEWEDRNILHEGQKLSFVSNIWQKLQDVRLSYSIPDFLKQDQNLIWLIDWHHDRNKSFSETALSLSGTFENKVNERLRVSYGGMYKVLRSMRSANNGIFDLVKVPLQLKWSTADSLLEPTKGVTVLVKSIPSLQILAPQFAYCINSFTGTHYLALTKNKKYIFATKLMLGTIFGANKHDIPPPERFFAGSENTIRGYRFLTISPRGRKDKPLGGRSLLVYTVELRSKFGDNLGLVLFYDMGNVYKNYFPSLKHRFLKALGIGLRYYTPIGPIRLDIAFPLDRRRKNYKKGYLDNFAEAYFSIGQSF